MSKKNNFIDKFFHSHLKNIFFYYLFFSFLFVVLSVVIISVVAFFHFQLEHDMSVIENWVYLNNWEIISLCKVLSLFIVLKTIRLRFYDTQFIKNFLFKVINFPRHYVFVIVIFLISFILSIGKVGRVNDDISLSTHQFVSFMGNFVFYFVDYVLLIYLRSLFSISQKWENYTFLLLSGFLFSVTSTLAIPSIQPVIIYLFLHMLTLLTVTLPFRNNILMGGFYLVLFVSPLASFVGLDPIWGTEFSPFELKNPLPFFYIVILWGLSFVYFYRVRGKRLVD